MNINFPKVNLKLALIRNQLINCNCDNKIAQQIMEISNNLIKNQNPFYSICYQSLANAIEDISKKQFQKAGYEINLIHNLPYIIKDIPDWDAKHFFTIEVPNYFDNNDDSERIQSMILILSKLILDIKNK